MSDEQDITAGEAGGSVAGESAGAVRKLASEIVWEETLPPTGETGPEIIAGFVKRLPNSPGVYRMMNAQGDVLYVGKAKSLKKRVASYAKSGGHSNRIARMIRETGDDGVHAHAHRDGGAAAGSEPHQAVAAALQRAFARRQELSLYRHHHRPSRTGHLQASRRRGRNRASISGRSPAPGRSTAPSTRCSAPS